MNDPVGCYKRINGPIKYSMAERKDWEKKFSAFLFRKKGKHFDPKDYPLTDLKQEPAKK